MNAKTFVDTNILIYAHDEDEPMKRSAASARLLALAKSGSLALSPQVLQEFYVNATRKLAKPLPKGAARQIVEDFSGWCISTGPTEVMMACRI